ncbi:hypothetical protein [Microbacter margulisiae]|uniref:Uncharacterized protein n=1 Tax=Microbacter margulisiae TaxID=1350067 RepID=A0A7W5DNN5_9PORP|nr:hypothetical protein [Microbacter margulisiae]MBB3186254.1 hypothetical protein [Microbacter margulisiae]
MMKQKEIKEDAFNGQWTVDHENMKKLIYKKLREDEKIATSKQAVDTTPKIPITD